MTAENTAASCDFRVGESVFVPVGGGRLVPGQSALVRAVVKRVFTIGEARRAGNAVNLHVYIPSAHTTVITHSNDVMKVGPANLE